MTANRTRCIAAVRSLRAVVATIAFTLLTGTGCEDDNDYDHSPPNGKGAMVVHNRNYDDLRVYVDGVRLQDVPNDKWRPYDLPPGVHRIVIQEDDGYHSYRDDIDIIAGTLTILDVNGYEAGNLGVDVYFD